MGIWMLSLGSLLAVASVVLDVGAPVRLLVAPVFLMGFLGVLQSRERTCVALAATGQCDLGAGAERIEDPEQRRAVTAKALAVLAKSVVATSLVTLVVALLP